MMNTERRTEEQQPSAPLLVEGGLSDRSKEPVQACVCAQWPKTLGSRERREAGLLWYYKRGGELYRIGDPPTQRTPQLQQEPPPSRDSLPGEKRRLWRGAGRVRGTQSLVSSRTSITPRLLLCLELLVLLSGEGRIADSSPLALDQGCLHSALASCSAASASWCRWSPMLLQAQRRTMLCNTAFCSRMSTDPRAVTCVNQTLVKMGASA